MCGISGAVLLANRDSEVQFHEHSPKAVPQTVLANEVGKFDAAGFRVQGVADPCLERRWDVEVGVISGDLSHAATSCKGDY